MNHTISSTNLAYYTFDLRALEFGDPAEEPLLQARVMVEVDAAHPTSRLLALRLAHTCLAHHYRVTHVTIHSDFVAETSETDFPNEHYPHFAEDAGQVWILSEIDRRGGRAEIPTTVMP